MRKEIIVLRDMLQARPYMLAKRESLRSLLLDLLSSDRPLVTKLLDTYDNGILRNLLELPERDSNLVNRIAIAFEQATGHDTQTSKAVAEICLFCIDTDTVKAWKAYQEQQRAVNAQISAEEAARNETSATRENPENPEETDDLPEGIFIPCGVGNADRGFVIQGVRSAKHCTHPLNHIFSLIWSYLQRNTEINENTDKPIFLSQYEAESKFAVILDYGRVYRIMMLILLLVKNNYTNHNLLAFHLIDPAKNALQETKIAVFCINRYLSLFCRFTGEKPIELHYQDSGPLTVSLDGSSAAGIRIVSYHGVRQSQRFPWAAEPIRYHVGGSMRKAFVYFLRELSNDRYQDFRSGQFESLCGMLNAAGHSICIMPTGSGKSLIFYICAILQPGTTFIVTPNRLLIEDQLRNLKGTHHFDNAAWLERNNSGALKVTNKLCYLTPETFQNTELLKEFIVLNSLKQIGYIILDEVHCISNWSHDFRPEYLMLSTYLNRYLDKTRYLCFTATANYSVIKDIQQQLQIENKADILSPVDLRKRYRFAFLPCNDEGEMAQETYQALKESCARGKKTLVFTKNEDCSVRLGEALSQLMEEHNSFEDEFLFEIHRQGDRAYQAFANGHCQVLIADEELGVGVNLADIDTIIHFGLPLSKGEYVQQIGRAGRDGSLARSTVIYLKCNTKNIDTALLSRTTSADKIAALVRKAAEQNDYTDIFRCILSNLGPREDFLSLALHIFAMVEDVDDYHIFDFPERDSNRVKKALFMLFAVGAIDNWSFYAKKDENILILINVQKKSRSLQNCKERARDYLYLLGCNQRTINLISGAQQIEDVISAYITWYYERFIYRHKEEFQDMLSLFEHYAATEHSAQRDQEINDRLAAYFSLSMLEISKDEEKYTHISFKEIAQELFGRNDHKTVENIQRINQNHTHVKLDFYIFIYTLLYDEEYDSFRLKRILDNCERADFFDLSEAASVIYSKLTLEDRMHLFGDLAFFGETMGENLPVLFDAIYRSNPKDMFYYGVMAKHLNASFC